MGNLTNKYVKDTYDGLIKLQDETSGVKATLQPLQDGLGNDLPAQVSSTEFIITGSLQGNASTATSASYATTASYAENVVLPAGIVSGSEQIILQDTTGDLSGSRIDGSVSEAVSASYAENATSASHAVQSDNATSSSYAENATSASHAVQADNATSASYALNGGVTSIIAGTNITIDQSTGDVTINSAGGVDTTYDLNSSQSGTDVDVNLVGSDATTDTVKLVAGSNITLTDDGSNNITIDAAGAPATETALRTSVTGKNVTGSPIPKGTPCFVTGSGTGGNLVGLVPADASNPSLMPATVIAGEDLDPDAEGEAIVVGFLNGVDTSLFAAGQSIYVAVGGGYTNVRPTGSAVLIQKLGNVEKVHPSNGSGVIKGPGWYNDIPNIQEGYFWAGDADGVAQAISTGSFARRDEQNTFTQNQTIQGTLNVKGGSGTDLIVTGTATITGTANINSQLTVGSTPLFTFMNGNALETINTTTGNIIGVSADNAAYGNTGWAGPGIWGNDPSDNYPVLIGFQGKTDWTDGRITMLKPTEFNGDIIAQGNVSLNNGTTNINTNNVDFYVSTGNYFGITTDGGDVGFYPGGGAKTQLNNNTEITGQLSINANASATGSFIISGSMEAILPYPSEGVVDPFIIVQGQDSPRSPNSPIGLSQMGIYNGSTGTYDGFLIEQWDSPSYNWGSDFSVSPAGMSFAMYGEAGGSGLFSLSDVGSGRSSFSTSATSMTLGGFSTTGITIGSQTTTNQQTGLFGSTIYVGSTLNRTSNIFVKTSGTTQMDQDTLTINANNTNLNSNQTYVGGMLNFSNSPFVTPPLDIYPNMGILTDTLFAFSNVLQSNPQSGSRIDLATDSAFDNCSLFFGTSWNGNDEKGFQVYNNGFAEMNVNVDRCNMNTVMRLQQQDPLPGGSTGDLAVSGSALYFHDGATWNVIS